MAMLHIYSTSPTLESGGIRIDRTISSASLQAASSSHHATMLHANTYTKLYIYIYVCIFAYTKSCIISYTEEDLSS